LFWLICFFGLNLRGEEFELAFAGLKRQAAGVGERPAEWVFGG
jgi:hypothetical protein